MKQNIFLTLTLITASLLLSACGKPTTPVPTPTPTPKLIEMPLAERPYISLVPRDDGHMLYLKIDKIPSYISQIEYEVLYNAVDNGSEIEKGIGDTIKEITASLERKLLLGTESCTNGCKYKYDAGIIGGTVTLNFIDKNGQVSTFETPFTLKSSADFKKDGELKLPTENFSVKPKTKITGNDFYILIKNYRGGYSVFSNGSNPTVGDYPQQ
jgi:hypothetical protein